MPGCSMGEQLHLLALDRASLKAFDPADAAM
jgi:hypothetical protein